MTGDAPVHGAASLQKPEAAHRRAGVGDESVCRVTTGVRSAAEHVQKRQKDRRSRPLRKTLRGVPSTTPGVGFQRRFSAVSRPDRLPSCRSSAA